MRADHLFSRADQAKRAARACGRAAAAAAITATAAVVAHATGGIALALFIVAALLARRIRWGDLERTQRAHAFGAEMWESFQSSNWRERTGWDRVAA